MTLPRKQGTLGTVAPPVRPEQGVFQAPPTRRGPVIAGSVSPCTHRDLLAADPHSLLFAERVSSLRCTFLWLLRVITFKSIMSSLEEPHPQSHTQAVAALPGSGLPLALSAGSLVELHHLAALCKPRLSQS